MKGFKLSDLLGEQTPATATTGGEWDIQHIPLDQITPAKNNNYRICDIEALADSIEIDGLMTPLLVREQPGGGKYELISGERRYTALKLLRSKGLEGYDTAPCKVETNVSDLMAEIKLIHANSTTRVLSDQEKVNQAARLAELFRQLRSSGVKVQGRKREFVAGMLGVSSAQVGRMESVDRNLVPDAKAEFQQGSMNFSTAYETSLLPADQQQQVVDDLRQGEKVDIKAVKQRRQPAAAPPAKQEPPAAMPPYAPGTPLNHNAEPGESQPPVKVPPAAEREPGAEPQAKPCIDRAETISELKTIASMVEKSGGMWSIRIMKTCIDAAILLEMG